MRYDRAKLAVPLFYTIICTTIRTVISFCYEPIFGFVKTIPKS